MFMTKLPITICALLMAATASAQPREAWIRKCQADDAELAGSTGYRVCTELYVMQLERRQKQLLRQVSARLAGAADDEGTDPKAAAAHLARSQQHWRRYVTEHCQAAQAMFGTGHTSGDAIPSCMAGEFELRNRQLGRILRGDYER